MAAWLMKEISEKLANELAEMLERAETLAAKAVSSAKARDLHQAEIFAISASCAIFSARTHLEWHIDGYKHVDAGNKQ
jgi:hypothetical protein